MKHHEIIHALRPDATLPAELPESCSDCPDPNQLAAWLGASQADSSYSTPGGGERMSSTLVEHLADCPFCSFQMSLISRGRTEETAATVPAELLHEVGRPIESTPSTKLKWRPEWLAWATAASLMIFVGLSTFREHQPELGPEDTAPVQTRFAGQEALRPQVLSPLPGSQVQQAELVVRWNKVPGSLFYDVHLVDGDGELLLRERVNGNRWLLPEHLKLEPGAEYFIRVSAWLNEANFLSSEHVAFSVGPNE
jgi:hypothetical protein